MLPEVEKYFSEKARLSEEICKKEGVTHADWDAYYRALDDLWKELGTSENKLVAWIGNNDVLRTDYPEHAIVVLRALPATIDQLDAIARERDWCYDWNRFRAAAISAGAIELDLKIQMKVNGGPWQEFWRHRLPGGSPLTKEEITQLFVRGINFIQFDSGADTIKYELAPDSPSAV